jgi:hypothetical protein
MIEEILNRFEPESEGLLREISKHISDDMLEEIAAADYGERADEHLVALRQVRDSGTFPEAMYWCPMEVLELTRWSEPDTPCGRPTEAVKRGHWMRAFSCAAILRAEHEPYNYLYNNGCIHSTIIQLILSLRALPLDFTPHAVKFFAWLLLHSDPEGQDEQVCAYGIGLLWFALHLASPVPDEMLVSLSQWILRRVEEFSTRLYCGSHPYLRKIGFGDLPPSRWELLGTGLFDLDLSARSPELREWIGLIGHELAG